MGNENPTPGKGERWTRSFHVHFQINQSSNEHPKHSNKMEAGKCQLSLSLFFPTTSQIYVLSIFFGLKMAHYKKG